MGFKTTLELFILVCVLGAIIFLAANPFDRPEEQTGGLLTIKPEDVSKVTIRHQNTRMECIKKDWEWFIRFPVEARADSARIERFLGVLETLTVQDAITSGQRRSRGLSLADYGLSPPVASLSLESQGVASTLLVGSRTPLGHGLYVKKAGSDLVLSTEAGIEKILPDNVLDWRNRQVFAGRDEKTVQIELWNRDGSFIQMLLKNSTWHMTQPIVVRANEKAVEQLLKQLYALEVKEFMWDPGWSEKNNAPGVVAENSERFAPYGLAGDQARARVALWQKGATARQELLLGKPVGENSGSVYARDRDKDSIYSVSSNALNYLDLSVADLRSRKLFALTPEEAAYINIQSGDKRLILTREPEGHWTIEEPLKWDADRKATAGFLEGLLNLEAESFVSETATNLTELGFNPPAWSVEVLEKPPSTEEQDRDSTRAEERPGQHRLLIARAPQGSNTVHARFSDDPVKSGDEGFIYSISRKDMAFIDGNPASALEFFDRTMMSLRPENIRKIETFTQERKEIVIRNQQGQWVSQDETPGEVNPKAIESILFAVSNLRASRVEDLALEEPAVYGLDKPSMQFSFGLSGEKGIQKTLKLGYKAGTKEIYAMIQGRDVVFALSYDTVKLFLQPLTLKKETRENR